MLTLTRTFDYKLVKEILANPRIYDAIASDYHPKREDFEPNESLGIHYLLATDNDVVLGLFIAHWIISPVTWEIHIAILPTAWYRSAEIEAAFEEWLWTETPCQTLVGHIPACNTLARRYVVKHGVKETGRIPKGYLKNGVLYDIVLFVKIRPLMV